MISYDTNIIWIYMISIYIIIYVYIYISYCIVSYIYISYRIIYTYIDLIWLSCESLLTQTPWQRKSHGKSHGLDDLRQSSSFLQAQSEDGWSHVALGDGWSSVGECKNIRVDYQLMYIYYIVNYIVLYDSLRMCYIFFNTSDVICTESGTAGGPMLPKASRRAFRTGTGASCLSLNFRIRDWKILWIWQHLVTHATHVFLVCIISVPSLSPRS